MSTSSIDLTTVLTQRGLLNAADLARVEQVRAATGDRLASTLVRLGLASEEDVARGFASANEIPFLTRDQLALNDGLADHLNIQFLRTRALMPLVSETDDLLIAMADPDDEEAIRAMRFATGQPVHTVVATFSDIAEKLAVAGGPIDIGDVGGDYLAGADEDIDRLLEDASDAPVIRLVQSLMSQAALRGASDVHVEPMARELLIRFRIDGQLVEAERFPDSFSGPVASRIKVLAGLDIAESRLPQDGRLRLTVRGREIDVRVATSPTAWGESIVLRLLGRATVPLDLEKLGLPQQALDALARALARPHGIILVTGPTGSGKTTTLYAAINRLRRPELKILTVEDPVEVLLEGINQVQIKPDIGLGFPETLRAFLRQDPDILMIGEIRDRDTADIAMRAALTGHLVLSTLHTNSALGAFTRLADLGVETYLTASTVTAAVAQRLVRALCTSCKTPRAVTSDEKALFLSCDVVAPSQLYEPVGCPECRGSGWRGRTPVVEVLEVDDTLRAAIRDGTTAQMAKAVPPARRLIGHGLALAAAGITTLSEATRAVDAA